MGKRIEEKKLEIDFFIYIEILSKTPKTVLAFRILVVAEL
jgi:hypothetical protein